LQDQHYLTIPEQLQNGHQYQIDHRLQLHHQEEMLSQPLFDSNNKQWKQPLEVKYGSNQTVQPTPLDKQ